MQTIARRLGQQSLRPSTSLKSIYPISDHHYGMDHERYVSTLATKGVGHLVRKGTGGRSSVSGIIATVFGATGFLGRYVVQQLAKMGSQVLVPFRGSEDNPRHLKLMGDLGQIVPMKYNPRDESSVKAVMAKANVVINLIGRDYETRNYSFEEVHYHMAEQLAKISKEHGGILRFIQVSCLGASPSSPSRMLRTKSAAEEMILRELPEATILKPAVMIGTEDRILNPWAHFAKKYGFLPLFGDGSTKIQPVYVIDVAAALTSLLKDDGTSMGKIYELGGPEIFTVHELADVMFDTIREWPRYVKVPFPIAKALATPREILLNKVPFPLPVPEILNLDKIQALTTDTVVSENALTFNDLGSNYCLEDQSQVFTSPYATYVGVYDGHGGPEASRFVNKRLFPYLHKFATEQGGLSVDVIKKAFSATEEEFLHLVKLSLPISPQIASVGSCCLFGAISNNVLYVANLGDSRAVLGRRDTVRKNSPVVAQRLSTDHNVADEEVRKEVEALHPDDSHIVVYNRGVWRIKGIIQVSRSIGDVYLKKPDFYRDPVFQQFGNPIPLKRPVMTAEPSIIIRELESQDLFLIFASDGLWEQLSDEAAVQIVFKHPRAGIAKRLVRAALHEAAKKREMRYDDIKKIDKGIRRHFHDDITVVVIYLDHHAGSSNGRFKQTGVDYTTAPVDIFSLNADEAEKRMLGTVA